MPVARPIPPIIGVSELRHSQKRVLDSLDSGPIVLTQRNQPLAVLVKVEMWNRLLEELTGLRDAQPLRDPLANDEDNQG